MRDGSHCMSGRPIGLHLINSRCGRGFAHDRLPRKIPGSRHRRLRATARMPRSSDLDAQKRNVDDDDDQVLTTDACKINFHGARCRQLVERCIGRSSRQRGQFVNGADLREPISSGYIKCNADCGRRRLSTAAAKQPRPHRNLSRRDRIARIGAPIERPCLRWSPSMKAVILAGGLGTRISEETDRRGPSRWSRSAAGRSSGTS